MVVQVQKKLGPEFKRKKKKRKHNIYNCFSIILEIYSSFCNLIVLDAFWLGIFIPTSLLTDLVPEN